MNDFGFSPSPRIWRIELMAAVAFCREYVLKMQSFAQASQGWYDKASVDSGPEHRSDETDLDLNPVSAASDKLSKPWFLNL